MDSRSLPGEDLQPEESHCPSCGIYVGTASKCPRCGTEVGKHISVRVFRWAAVVLAVGGLILLYLMATHRELPLMKVEELQPTMNFAYIRISGTVVEEPRIFRKDQTVRSLRFIVDDGTGEIAVTAYRTQAQELVDAHRVPRVGQQVVVAGSLAVTGGKNLLLRLQTPEHLTIEGGEGGGAEIEKLEMLDPDREDEYCTVEGRIDGIYAPKADSRQPWMVTIKDDTGRGLIVFWEDIQADLEKQGLLQTGIIIRATALIGTFRGRVQLKPRDAYDIVRIDSLTPVAPEPEPEAVPVVKSGPRFLRIAEVNHSMTGQWVTVRGTVTGGQPFKLGYYIDLKDGTDTVRVVTWEKQIPADQLPELLPGTEVTINGRVATYSNRLEIIPVKASAIKPIAGAGP